MPQHMVLIGFNEAVTNKRHEAGEIADLSHIPDVRDLIANGTATELDRIELTPEPAAPIESEESE